MVDVQRPQQPTPARAGDPADRVPALGTVPPSVREQDGGASSAQGSEQESDVRESQKPAMSDDAEDDETTQQDDNRQLDQVRLQRGG